MKKINKFIFFLFFLYPFKSLAKEIINFEALIEEKNGEKIVEYKLKVLFPSKLHKEIIFPLNRNGELYIYNNKKKIIFYPSINYILEENEEEDNFLKILKDIKEFFEIKSSKIKLRRRNIILQFKDKRLYLIKYPNNTKIFLKNYILKDEIYFPQEIEILARDDKTIIKIKEINFNLKFEDKDFEVKR